MRVSDLLAVPSLELRLRTPQEPEQLCRSIQGCAVTEMMNPIEYLSPGELMLTTGMGLHFKDPRTWDAYAERLAGVPVSALAFRLGPVHAETPDGLVAACVRHRVPLLELPAAVARLQLSRHIWQELAAERYEVVRDGWELANECMRAAAEGGTIADVVARVARAVGARVTVLDPNGFPLVSAGTVPAPRPGLAASTLALPGEQPSFRLRIDGVSESMLLMPLLGPVCGVIAMQLSYTLLSRMPLHSQVMAHFVTALRDGGQDLDAIRTYATEAGFDPGEPWHLVLVEAGDATSATLRHVSWRLRVRLESLFGTVRFFEEGSRTILLAQGMTAGASVPAALEAAIEDTGMGGRHAEDVALEVLPLVLQLGRRAGFAPGVHRVPALDLAAIAAALPGPAVASLADRLLLPVREADPTGVLEETLRAHLEACGSTRAVCDRLSIHRNTLSYRMQRIESLLGLDLSDGDARATCLLALRIAG